MPGSLPNFDAQPAPAPLLGYLPKGTKIVVSFPPMPESELFDIMRRQLCEANKTMSDLTRRLAEAEESHRVISKSNRAALHRMIAAEARVRELEACFPAPLTHAQTLAKRALLAGQIKQAQKGRVVTLPCAGCGRTISLTVARKCHWCGCWYCAECSDVHFGANPDKVRAAALAATEVPA